MPINPDLRYAQVPVEPELFERLGIDPAEAGVREIRACLGSLGEILGRGRALGLSDPIQVAAALDRYGQALAAAREQLDRSFGRAEWNFMADVMNGCLSLQDYTAEPVSTAAMLLANVQDGHALDGTGYKWFGEEDRAESDRRVAALAGKLMRLSPIDADAIGQAIREFWDNCETINPATDRWWLPRREPRARGRS
jgi:hypothetical protein